MQLIEIFDTDLPLAWNKNGNIEQAVFKCDEEIYVIQIEIKPLLDIPELKGKKTAEVSFFKHVEGEENSDKNFSTNQTKTFSISVYSVVGRNLKRKFADFDAFYFSAEKRHSNDVKEFDRKKQIYRSLADRLRKDISYNIKIYETENNSSATFIVSDIKFSKETTEKTGFVCKLDEAMESFYKSEVWANMPTLKRKE